MSKLEDVGEFIGMGIFWIIVTYFTIGLIIIRPIWFLFDRRRYKIPNELFGKPLGLFRFYCLAHYSLKEDATCPNCGRTKKELIK